MPTDMEKVMTVYGIFNRSMTPPSNKQPRSVLPPDATAPGTTPKPAHQGVFVSKESLASFAGASCAVTLIWTAVGILIPSLNNNPWSAFVISCAIGVVIYLIHETDPDKLPETTRDKLMNVIVAVINVFVLFSAALGIDKLT